MPNVVPRMEAWARRADAFAARRAEFARALDALRATAAPRRDADRERDATALARHAARAEGYAKSAARCSRREGASRTEFARDDLGVRFAAPVIPRPSPRATRPTGVDRGRSR